MLQLSALQESAVTFVYKTTPVAECDHILMPGVNPPQYHSNKHKSHLIQQTTPLAEQSISYIFCSDMKEDCIN